MFLTDSQGKLIKELNTSFELSYSSICGKKISLKTLLDLRNKKDNGWIRFYPTSDSYGPDTDDTSLFYIALIKKDPIYFYEASQFINQYQGIQNHHGLVVTWPHRNKLQHEQEDYVVNLHFLWLSHLVGKKNETIENKLLAWLEQDNITTQYYHNENFILFSCQKALEDFMESEFKDKFKDLLRKKNKEIVKDYDQLCFPQGVFRHIGKDVFFHFFLSENNTVSNLISHQNLEEYYKVKKNLYGNINNEDDVLSSYNFKDSLFYKMGTIRLNQEGDIIKDPLCMFDTTIYTTINNNAFVTEKSLSIRLHLNRALVHLPTNIQNIIKNYWHYSANYIQENFHQQSPNSFFGIHTGKINIPKHKHYNVKSTFTFILSVGDETNNSQFIVGDDIINFPQNKFFALHFDGEKKTHEVVKNDNNTYFYFIFDLDFEKESLKNSFIVLPNF